MTFSSISAKTTFSWLDPNEKFTPQQEQDILKAMEQAYTYSSTARKMFDDWVSKSGKTITISFDKNQFSAGSAKDGNIYGGNIYIDPAYLNGRSYINDKGKAVPYTLLQAITHELGHALNGTNDPNGTRDPVLGDSSYDKDYRFLTDYRGNNVPFINTIWGAIRLTEISSK